MPTAQAIALWIGSPTLIEISFALTERIKWTLFCLA